MKFVSTFFILWLFTFGFSAYGGSPENCAMSKRGDHHVGAWRSTLDCIQNKNCDKRRKRVKRKRRDSNRPASKGTR